MIVLRRPTGARGQQGESRSPWLQPHTHRRSDSLARPSPQGSPHQSRPPNYPLCSLAPICPTSPKPSPDWLVTEVSAASSSKPTLAVPSLSPKVNPSDPSLLRGLLLSRIVWANAPCQTIPRTPYKRSATRTRDRRVPQPHDSRSLLGGHVLGTRSCRGPSQGGGHKP